MNGKLVVWAYLARTEPKKPRTEQAGVVAIRVDEWDKQGLLTVAPEKFFTDDHYRAYPAVLVRLSEVDEAELRELIEGAWRLRAGRSTGGPQLTIPKARSPPILSMDRQSRWFRFI